MKLIAMAALCALLAGCATATRGWAEYPMPEGARYYERDTVTMFLGVLPVNMCSPQRGVRLNPYDPHVVPLPCGR